MIGFCSSGHGFFEQLLRVVYRLIFLFAAEDRGLLHAPNASEQARRVYAEGYSLARLRERSMRRTAWDRNADGWEGLKATFRALTRGQEQLGLPALGGLFAQGVVPDLESARIENRRLLAAIWRLAWLRPEGQPLTRVNWRDMETEELGSVYESLLELTPRASADARTFEFAEGDETRGNARKTSGSYYTPEALVKLLLDSTLEPVLDAAEVRNPEDPAAEILKLSIIDPACGSGHFLLGAARRTAARITKHRSPGAPSQEEFQHALREVVSHCIYGVDRNPMAVELCKVALWIEALDPGKPLTFLDSHIRCGDSLIGVFDYSILVHGIPDAAYKPLGGDSKEVAKIWAKFNKEQRDGKAATGFLAEFRPPGEIVTAARRLAEMPEDTLEQIEAKREEFERLHIGRNWLNLKTACDLFVSAFFVPKQGDIPKPSDLLRATIPTTEAVWRAAKGEQPHGPLLAQSDEIAVSIGAFHWPLEFTDVFARGGFDVFLGNPPWDKLGPDGREFFSRYDTSVRFLSPREQDARFEELLQMPGIRALWEAYCRDIYARASFIKHSDRYRLFASGNLGKGEFNVYRMFVELALGAISRTGIAAQFVPETLYNGANATEIRKHLFQKMRLQRLIAFENSKKIWFDIDTRAKFCLYVATRNGPTISFPCAFGVNSKEKLADASAHRLMEMPVALIEEFSPEALAVSEVQHPSDISVSKKIYARFPKFGLDVEGLAIRTYARELDMTHDRGLFVEDYDCVPVYEGRMVDAFDHRAKAYKSGRARAAEWEELTFGSPRKAIAPQWYVRDETVPADLVGRWDLARVGFCKVVGATNQRALLAALIPPKVVCGNSVSTILFDPHDDRLSLFWLGVANSFCLDFVVRKKMSINMTYTVVDSLPLPRRYTESKLEKAIASRSLLLSATGTEMTDYFKCIAPLVGVDPMRDRPVESDEPRRLLRAEIDVLVARDLFGLTYDEMRYVLDPSDVLGADCDFETFGALKRAEEQEFGGSFRSRDMILETWRALPQPVGSI